MENNRAEQSHEADQGEGTRDEAVQIDGAGTAIRHGPRGCLQFIQSRQAPSQGQALSGPEGKCVRRMKNASSMNCRCRISLVQESLFVVRHEALCY